jgi:hypothetical protein
MGDLRPLLCPRRERPSDRCAPNHLNEIASFHYYPPPGSGLPNSGFQRGPSKQEITTGEIGVKGKFALQKSRAEHVG